MDHLEPRTTPASLAVDMEAVFVSPAHERALVATMAQDVVVDGTSEQSGDLVWQLVELEKSIWALARGLAGSLYLEDRDVVAVIKMIDTAIKEQLPVRAVVREMDARGIRSGSDGLVRSVDVVKRVAEAMDLTIHSRGT